MPTSEPLERGDVVVIPFPYADKLAEKRRPGLVVSGPELSGYGLVWVAMITSASHRAWECDVHVRDLVLAGLPKPSIVRPAKLACIDRDRIVRRAGRLDDISLEAVARQIRRFLPET